MNRLEENLGRYIGQLLLEAQLVTPAQLQNAIQIQEDSGEMLGQVLVRQQLITQEQLVDLLELQLQQRLKEDHSSRRQLGEILLSIHAISRWQLSHALSLQEQHRGRIGEMLIELGFTTRGSIEQALSHQAVGTEHQTRQPSRRSLGELLLQTNHVTPASLKAALKEQRSTQEYLGDILIRQGVLSEDELEDLLATQLLLACQATEAQVQPVHKKLGEILVETHQLTPAQLDQAVTVQQKQQHRRLGDILIEKGLLPLRELLRALRLQKRLATLTMATVTGVTLLAACGTPQVPLQYPIQNNGMQIAQFTKPGAPRSARQGAFKTLQVDNGNTLQIFQNGSRVIDNVPYFNQGNDNTCGQAVMSMLLNFWGIEMGYQEVVNEANPNNLPTTDHGIMNYLRSKGLKAQAFRGATVDNLIAQVNKGHPSVVLLDFGGLSQEHYVVVVGYNTEAKTLIVHDSLEGPYIEMPMTRFATMWENRSIRLVHIFGGENYRRMMIDVSR
ncbi:MAG: C39 family peptidase [Candidatus Sericytochromatia bacterium]